MPQRLGLVAGTGEASGYGGARGLTAAVAAADVEPDDVEADEDASMLPESKAADAVDPLVEAGCARKRCRERYELRT